METLQTLKAFIARLAGAPLNPIRPHDRGVVPVTDRSSKDRSGLYVPSTVHARSRTARQRDGDEGEDYARRYLECAGLVFVAGNVRYRDGELDLVMRDGRDAARHGTTLVFIEVRRRATGNFGGAAASVTREKRRRLVAAASHYLVALGLRELPPCRFDVVTVSGDAQQGFAVEWIRNAFRDEG